MAIVIIILALNASASATNDDPGGNSRHVMGRHRPYKPMARGAAVGA
jgi:hypothetical protein